MTAACPGAQVNAHMSSVVRESVVYELGTTKVNGQRSSSFAADGVESIDASLGRGDDLLTLLRVDLDGDSTASLGDGRDELRILASRELDADNFESRGWWWGGDDDDDDEDDND